MAAIILRTGSVLVFMLLFIAQSASAAEDGVDGYVTVGAGGLAKDTDSYKYGEYTGLKDDTVYFVGDAFLTSDSGPYYLEVIAHDLGLENRRVRVEAGEYGVRSFFLSFSQTPQLISSTGLTPFIGAGSQSLTLPAGFVTGDTTALMTITGLTEVDLETHRTKGSVGYSRSYGDHADVSIQFTKELKEGTKSIGGTVRQAGGGAAGARSTVLPEPVDYDTDEVRVSLGWTKEDYNLGFDYLFSAFDNTEDSITWENPFFSAAYNAGANGPDAQTARISLPPDNYHHKFTLSGGTNLPWHHSRVSAVLEHGIMIQNDELQAYTINPNVVINTPRPRTKASGDIRTWAVGLNASTRPMNGLALRARYRYYDMDNNTDRDLWQRVRNDTGTQAAVADAQASFNLPYAFSRHTLNLDGSYYVFRGTTVKLGYDYERYERDFREVEDHGEHTVRGRISTTLNHMVSGSVYGSYSNRQNDGYDEGKVYNAIHSSEFVTACLAGVAADCFDNHPLIRKLDVADRGRVTAGASATVFPTDMVSLGLYFDYRDDDFYNSTLGIIKDKSRSYTVDVTATPTNWASVYAFYTYELLEAEQAGWDFTAAGPPGTQSTQAADPTRRWWVEHENDIDTFGVGASAGFLEDRATVSADYTYAASEGRIDFRAGTNAAVANPMPVPTLITKHQSLKLKGKYALTDKLDVGAGYNYDVFRHDDWATDGFAPASTTLANVLTLTTTEPDYEAHLITLFFTYNFGA